MEIREAERRASFQRAIEADKQALRQAFQRGFVRGWLFGGLVVFCFGVMGGLLGAAGALIFR